ncbi:MAG TPA: flagellar export protein FliJ [Steroidobacteraceae bacterium]|jgi:flagellar protein FliJ|nr:flagellar export protein FliJ [Steroidobacteraceae bacterium]
MASKQLQVVQRVTDNEKRRQAERLAARERRVLECEAKLTELTSYQANYAREFAERAGRGIDGARLRAFQTFLARLAEAVRQQLEIVERVRAERDADRDSWRRAAQRAEMVDHVVKRRVDEERRALDRQEQRESDERSLRKHQPRPTKGQHHGE